MNKLLKCNKCGSSFHSRISNWMNRFFGGKITNRKSESGVNSGANKIMIPEQETVWDFTEIWNPTGQDSSQNKEDYVMILLNRPVLDETKFVPLWNGAKIRIAVDGGGNRWSSLRKKHGTLLYPTIACGDFDSIIPKILEEFKSSGKVKVVKTPDQDETDFTKSLRVLKDEVGDGGGQEEPKKILVFCETNGRLDHIMANIETLFHSLKILPPTEGYQIYLTGSTSVSFLLPPGHHTILCKGLSVPHCALIPIGTPCSSVTTTGLKWNLDEGSLSFGKLVSTSNALSESQDDKQEVTINNSDPLLWWMELGEGEEDYGDRNGANNEGEECNRGIESLRG